MDLFQRLVECFGDGFAERRHEQPPCQLPVREFSLVSVLATVHEPLTQSPAADA